jgi:hypothetical protein
MQPLCLSGADLGLLYEEGEAIKKELEGKGWRRMITSEQTAVTVAAGDTAPSATATTTKPVQRQPSRSPVRSPVRTAARSPVRASVRMRSAAVAPAPPVSAVPAAAASAAFAASSSSSSLSPSSTVTSAGVIRHTLTPSSPYLPSDSGSAVLARGLFKLHFRFYALVRYRVHDDTFETYWCNLSKVYHAPEHLAEIKMQPPPMQQQQKPSADPSASAASPSSSSSPAADFDAAAGYFLAQNRPPLSASAPSPLFPSLSSLPPSVLTFSPAFHSPSLSFPISVSKYLSMRLAHHIFPPDRLTGMMQAMATIVADTVRTAIDGGGFYPCGHFERPVPPKPSEAAGDATPAAARPPVPGLASASYFQFLGYDFLWDTLRDQPVLLEVNNNVGQGLMSQEVMSKQTVVGTATATSIAAADTATTAQPQPQQQQQQQQHQQTYYGLSNAQYSRMRDYWRTHFRLPFVEGAMRVNVDALSRDSEGRVRASPAPSTLAGATAEPPRLPSSPPAPSDLCWVLADVYQRPPGVPVPL